MRLASIIESILQQPFSLAKQLSLMLSYVRKVTPTNSYPCSKSNMADTVLSIPPLIAINTLPFFVVIITCFTIYKSTKKVVAKMFEYVKSSIVSVNENRYDDALE